MFIKVVFALVSVARHSFIFLLPRSGRRACPAVVLCGMPKADEGSQSTIKALIMLKTYARNLRKEKIDAEIKLWQLLRDRRLLGYKFRRQYWIQNYRVDFICLEKKLIIELDGCQHMNNEKYDLERIRQLSSLGFNVLRFWNNDIYDNIDEVMDKLYSFLKYPHPPYGHLLPQAGEGKE